MTIFISFLICIIYYTRVIKKNQCFLQILPFFIFFVTTHYIIYILTNNITTHHPILQSFLLESNNYSLPHLHFHNYILLPSVLFLNFQMEYSSH